LETIGDWVRHCRDRLDAGDLFFGHGTDNAADEAAWLVLHQLGLPVDGSFADWERQVEPSAGEAVASLLESRIESRKPLAYLLGEAWFCGLRFRVDETVLVPRSPIAELISGQFRPWIDPETLDSALDLCTGSACIAVAMAVSMPWLKVDAVDLSPEAVLVARSNVRMHGLGERVEVMESDLFEAVHGRSYGLVVGNPPYVPAAALEQLPMEYRAEPELGLVSGADGLELPLQILLEAPDFLAEGGLLVLEVGESAARLQNLLPDVPFTWLEFEHGGEGVFTMERKALVAARTAVAAAVESRRNVG
jgi:ribosomal protein L3 glutamine methyltransferase